MYSMVLMAALTTGTDLPDFGRRGGCHGCWGGGCWGGGCWGGGCYGGWGGCYGRGYGYGGGYGWGGWGGGWGGGWAGGWGGGYAGYNGWGGLGGIVYTAPLPTYAMPMLAYSPTTGDNTTTSMYYNPDPDAARRATIIVHVPADAKLMVDGKATRSTSATRRFVSPPLEPDTGYHYIFKAKIERDGEPLTVEKRVEVRAGQIGVIEMDFNDVKPSAVDKKQ